MIWLISGEINSGKTSRILEIYRQKAKEKAGGFISRKLFQNNAFCGYEIVRLPDGPCQTLAWLRTEFYSNNELNENNGVKKDKSNKAENPKITVAFPYGQFMFLQAGFIFGEIIINDLLDDKAVSDIFIDEIGSLELQNRGFYGILLKTLQSDRNLYVTVRTSCLEPFLEKFNIQEYELLAV